jgi:hypothetical protein
MALNDIFQARFHFETPSGKAGCGLYYRETTANASNNDTCLDLANALHASIVSPLRGILSNKFRFTGIEVNQMHPTVPVTAINPPNNVRQRATRPKACVTVDGPGQIGEFAPPDVGLPSNNSVQFDLIQNTFGLRSNGRMNIPGIPESQSAGGTLIAGYVTTCNVLAAALALAQTSPSDIGVWEPVIVSAIIRDLLGPGNPKDWTTSIAPITDVQTNPIIAIQRRRVTEVVGGVR